MQTLAQLIEEFQWIPLLGKHDHDYITLKYNEYDRIPRDSAVSVAYADKPKTTRQQFLQKLSDDAWGWKLEYKQVYGRFPGGGQINEFVRSWNKANEKTIGKTSYNEVKWILTN